MANGPSRRSRQKLERKRQTRERLEEDLVDTEIWNSALVSSLVEAQRELSTYRIARSLVRETEDSLSGQALHLFRFLSTSCRPFSFEQISSVRGVFQKDNPPDLTISRAIERLDVLLRDSGFTVEISSRRAELIELGRATDLPTSP